MITVFTVSTGQRSDVQPPLIACPHVDYVAFVDDLSKPVPEPYRKVLITPTLGITHHGRLSRLPKIQASAYATTADISIYHDASMTMRISPREAVEKYLGEADVAVYGHPSRCCAYAEAALLIEQGIGVRAEVERQVEHMRTMGFPAARGLYACGIIIRRHNHVMQRLERTWWGAFHAGCERDQVSFPFAVWRERPHVAAIPGNVYDSPIAKYHGHRKPAS